LSTAVGTKAAVQFPVVNQLSDWLPSHLLFDCAAAGAADSNAAADTQANSAVRRHRAAPAAAAARAPAISRLAVARETAGSDGRASARHKTCADPAQCLVRLR
jgi:hypothetical protein